MHFLGYEDLKNGFIKLGAKRIMIISNHSLFFDVTKERCWDLESKFELGGVVLLDPE